MIKIAKETLIENGLNENAIHFELFSTSISSEEHPEIIGLEKRLIIKALHNLLLNSFLFMYKCFIFLKYAKIGRKRQG